jgi:hypothetical protein
MRRLFSRPGPRSPRRRWSGRGCWSSGLCSPAKAGRRRRTRCVTRRPSPATTRNAAARPASAAGWRTRRPASGYGTGPTRPGPAARPLLDFRRGLVSEHIADAPQAALAAYQRAHAGAQAQDDPLLLSFTWQQLAGLALRDGDPAKARQGFTECLRIREELGYLIGTAPALAGLAECEAEPVAGRLRAEAYRLFRLLGGVPVWLGAQLPPVVPPQASRAEPEPAGQ